VRGRGLAGNSGMGRRYLQDHLPVRTTDTEVGHVVRALYLEAGVTDVAAETEILPFAMVGAKPGHLKDAGEGTELVVGARVSIREGVSLHRGTKIGSGRTVLGDECTW